MLFYFLTVNMNQADLEGSNQCVCFMNDELIYDNAFWGYKRLFVTD